MAAYLKERDPNHLVTVGLEGFWGADTQVSHLALATLQYPAQTSPSSTH